MTEVNVSSLQKEMMQEVVNIGVGHAVNALAQMMDRKVTISVPSVEFIPLADVPEKAAKEKGPEEVIVGLYFRILGDLQGNMLLMFSRESAQKLIWLLLKNSGAAPENNPNENEMERIALEQSALMEVGNILANSFLNSLALMTDFKLFPSIPHYAEDMMAAVLDFILIEVAQTADSALYLETEWSIESTSIAGEFLIFLDSDSLKQVLEKVTVT